MRGDDIMMSMRDAFGQSLVALAGKRDDFVVLDADVAGGTGTAVFRDAYPKRFIQCGIAEQNMMSMAAGLSTTGVIPIVTCYAVFAALRAVEQARNSIAYPDFNVKIAVSHLGLDVGPDGPTHQAVEDMAVMRAIPNMSVVSPADPVELSKAVEVILDTPGPVYLRTGRSPLPTFLDEDTTFEFGKAAILREGGDATVVAVGVMVWRALQAAEMLSKESIAVRVVNMSSIKPLDNGVIEDSARITGAIVTAEDHNINGGLGGAVAEAVCDTLPVPVVRLGLPDIFAESGEPDDLAEKYGLMPRHIVAAVKIALERKKAVAKGNV